MRARSTPAAGAAAALSLAGALLVAAAGGAVRHPDRPPPAHTGGFGEPTCHVCHFDFDPGTGPGRLRIDGVPATPDPGSEYRITVVLTAPAMAAAGFQFTARFRDGRQAGLLGSVPRDSRVETTVHGDVIYAHHSFDGTRPVAPDSTRWTILWRTPADLAEPVLFHAAAVAADADLSPLGDHVHTATAAAGADTAHIRR